jgi:hypothetical protein
MEILRGKRADHLDTARVMRPPKSFRSCGARGVPNVRALTGASSYADEDALAFRKRR